MSQWEPPWGQSLDSRPNFLNGINSLARTLPETQLGMPDSGKRRGSSALCRTSRLGSIFQVLKMTVRVIRTADVRFVNQAGLGILAEVGFEFSSDPPPDRPDPFTFAEEVHFVKTGTDSDLAKEGIRKCLWGLQQSELIPS